MYLATILGSIGGFSLVLVIMASSGRLIWFLDRPSAMIVPGGTLGTVLINYPFADMRGVIKWAKHVFLKREQKVGNVIRYVHCNDEGCSAT